MRCADALLFPFKNRSAPLSLSEFQQGLLLRLFRRCFFAAFMLSTRFGYGRPARFAEAFAIALLFALNFICRLLRDAGFFQGCILLFVAIIGDSLSALFGDVGDRIGLISNLN